MQRMQKTQINVLSNFSFSIFRKVALKLGIPISEYRGSLLAEIKPSTITVGGKFSGVAINEKEDITKFTPNGNIVMIGCNYGENIADDYDPNPEVKVTVGKKRGRKPKPKEKKKRIVGSGKYFNSQITFVIKSTVKAKKVYKFKVYRNGRFQVPGVLNPDLSDMKEPMEELIFYLSERLGSEVQEVEHNIQMRNCKTVLQDTEIRINTVALGELIEAEMKGNNEMKISSVSYNNGQCSSRTTVKFDRTISSKVKKMTTMKIMTQKINYEGAILCSDIEKLNDWLNKLLLQNYNKVIIDPEIESESDSDSD